MVKIKRWYLLTFPKHVQGNLFYKGLLVQKRNRVNSLTTWYANLTKLQNTLSLPQPWLMAQMKFLSFLEIFINIWKNAICMYYIVCSLNVNWECKISSYSPYIIFLTDLITTFKFYKICILYEMQIYTFSHSFKILEWFELL